MIQNLENFKKATRYLEAGRHDKALTFFKKQIKQTGGFKECYLNIGNCLQHLNNQRDEAYNHYLLAADPHTPYADGGFGDYEFALNNLGLLEYGYEHDHLACDFYQRVLELNPKNYDARWNLGITEIRRALSGDTTADLNRGWVNYDFRFYQSHKNRARVDLSVPRWDGVSSGRSIVVLSEQGLGDKFQWLRYVKVLEERFDTVWVQLPKVLHDVFKLSGFKVVERVEECDAEVCIPLCSLNRWIPINAAPADYLTKPEAYHFSGGVLNVGICGVGSTTHVNNTNRSCGTKPFEDLAGVGVKLYNLTPGSRSTKHIETLNPSSWIETASYLLGLDLVISVDTSIVHLAGALGIPCWVLLPSWDTDFRWGDSTCGSSTVWYPNHTVFRNPQDWGTVFKNVKECLNHVKDN
jgi:hypothetical protein